MGEADAPRRLAALVIQQRHRQPAGQDVEHRDADIGAFARDAPRNQRFEGRGMGRRDIDEEMPTPPVIEDNPDSAWARRS